MRSHIKQNHCSRHLLVLVNKLSIMLYSTAGKRERIQLMSLVIDADESHYCENHVSIEAGQSIFQNGLFI